MIVREDLLRLALDITGLTEERWNAILETLKDDAAMNRAMKRDWERTARDSESAIRDYYRKSDIWFANTWNHGMGGLLAMARLDGSSQLRPWHQAFVQDFTMTDRILDYGGGFFNDTYPLVMVGYKVSIAEVKGPVTEYLKRYRSLTNLEDRIEVIEVDGDLPLSETYHGIACFETLEHLLRPLDMIRHFHDHLASGRPFAFSVSFGNPSYAPYHVAENAYLGNERVFTDNLKTIGFHPHWRDDRDRHFQIWRRT